VPKFLLIIVYDSTRFEMAGAWFVRLYALDSLLLGRAHSKGNKALNPPAYM
jgi:hypothetical protein